MLNGYINYLNKARNNSRSNSPDTLQEDLATYNIFPHNPEHITYNP
jgi:hypothetical protein